jgi:hypothetical protein
MYLVTDLFFLESTGFAFRGVFKECHSREL